MLRNFGMDYGVKPKMVLLSDMSFQEELQAAKFNGFIYDFNPNLDGEEIPTEIGFRFENEPHAEKFFDSLIHWYEESGGDSKAINMEFTELNNGDYAIVLSPDMEMLIKRMVPEHIIDRIDPLTFIASRNLHLIDQSGMFKKFRAKYVEGRRIVVRYFIFEKDGKIRPSEKYFVKTEFSFYKEDELPKNSMAYMNLKGGKKDIKKRPMMPADHPGLLKHRLDDLKYFFPVTLDKLTSENWLNNVTKTINKSYTNDQITQAICNLILFERLKKDEKSKININKPGYDLDIITHLAETFESFDSFFPENGYFTKQVIEKQIRADVKFLKEKLSKP
ncbi:hypothetical protein [Mucilaginibacter sp. SJ]|uniref:hypothetical protein n=1 Tax=Mucilaginibacter sp. SJ TaxID=3029053 RepID=UPI0023A9E6B1|nr:hypothetical protein [Mucilaginibacter sp. SJ]WEA00710.1 hypothetical protein MusilaSJ_24970 [Mucilaginibacter sp. SJ]